LDLPEEVLDSDFIGSKLSLVIEVLSHPVKLYIPAFNQAYHELKDELSSGQVLYDWDFSQYPCNFALEALLHGKCWFWRLVTSKLGLSFFFSQSQPLF
jgi:hypothetical protein